MPVKKSSGACRDVCRDTFSGSKCLCPSNCTCDLKGFCQSCSTNSEIICNDFCSKGCVNFVCLRISAKCLFGCKEGYQGETCIQVQESRSDDRHSSAILIVVSAISVCVTVVLLTVFCMNRIRKRRNPMVQDRREEAYDLANENYSTIPDNMLERTAPGEHISVAQTSTPHSAADDTSRNYFSPLGAKKNPRGTYTALSNSPASRQEKKVGSEPSERSPAADKNSYLLPVSQTASDFDNQQATKITLSPAEVSTEEYITPVYTVNVGPSGQASDVSVHNVEDTRDDYLIP